MVEKSLTTMTQLPQHGIKHQLPHLHGKKKTDTEDTHNATFVIHQRIS